MLRALPIDGAKQRYYQGYALQFVSCLLLIMALISAFLVEYPRYIAKTHLVEALIAASLDTKNLSAFFMENGYWPPASEIRSNASRTSGYRNYVDSTYFDGKGGLHLHFSTNDVALSAKTLSFLATTNSHSRPTSIIWTCGFAEAPTDYRKRAQNRTDLPPALLISTCRNTHSTSSETQ